MSREIKFRAKFKDSKIKEWAYGSLNKEEWDSANFKYSLSIFFELLEQGFLDPETVGQLVCKDKNKKDVFAGDKAISNKGQPFEREGTVVYRPMFSDYVLVKDGYGNYGIESKDTELIEESQE